MKTKIWTDDKIAALPAPRKGNKVYPVTDDGLKIRVYPSGFKAFGYTSRNGAGHPQFYPLGEFGVGPDRAAKALSLSEAHKGFLTRTLQKISQDRVATRAKMVDAKKDATFYELLEDFLTNVIDVRPISKDRKTRYRYVLSTHFLNQLIPDGSGKWGNLRLSDFVAGNYKKDYHKTLRKVQQQVTRTGSQRAPSNIGDVADKFAQQMFEYGVAERYLTHEDCPTRVDDLNKARVLKRYLSIPEIETLFNATSTQAVASGKGINEYDAMFLRLLLLTGCRATPLRLSLRSDIGSSRKGFWTFPWKRNKLTVAVAASPEDHLVPMTDLLKSELKRLDEVSGDYDILFPERWAGHREEVKERSKGWACHVVVDHTEQLSNDSDDPYTAHALRRTMNNVMRELDIPDEVIHVCSSRVPKGVDATYLTTKLRPQCVIAYEKYHAFLLACMQGKGQEWMDEVTKEKRQALRNELDSISKKLKLKPIAGVRV